MVVGNNVKKVRSKKMVSQADLAKSTGVSVRHIQFIEDESRCPSLAVALKMASGLKEPVGKIFYLKNVL